MIIRAVDLETTGLKTEQEPKQGIMQIGFTDLDGETIGVPTSAFVDCGIPVSIEARAVHHISDETCAGELTPDQATMMLMEGPHQYFAAHNVDHEKEFFGGGERPWFCTYKTALRLWPDAPGHKLNELRYFLDLDDNEDFDQQHVKLPHRAPDDSYICAHLVRRIMHEAEIQKVDFERMLAWSKGPALLYMCWFKKHRGTPWHEVPVDYLRWVVDNVDQKERDARATAKYWLKRKTEK